MATRPDRVRILLAGIFLPWAAGFASLGFSPSVPRLDDSAQYLLISKSLASGLGLANVAFPGVPAFLAVPSAFPILLMPWWWLPDPPVVGAHLAMAAALIVGAWASFLWLERMLPRMEAILAALAFASGPWFVLLSGSLLTEAPCILLLYGGLWLAARDADRGSGTRDGWLALACFLILFRLRVNCMPFLVVHLLVLARRGERARWLAGAALALVWLGAERLWAGTEAGGYLRHDMGRRFDLAAGPLAVAAELARAMAGTAWAFLSGALGDLMLPVLYGLRPMDPAKRLAILLLSAWALAGLWLLWRRRPELRPYLVAFALSWAPFLLQRSVALPRYAFPSFPLLAACLALPLLALAERFRSAPGRSAWAPALLLLVLANQALESLRDRELRGISEERAGYGHVHAFIRAAPQPPDVVLSVQHYHAHLETGLPALDFQTQWGYAARNGLVGKDSEIWMIIPAPPEAARGWDPGHGWSLGAGPLAERGGISLFPLLRAAP